MAKRKSKPLSRRVAAAVVRALKVLDAASWERPDTGPTANRWRRGRQEFVALLAAEGWDWRPGETWVRKVKPYKIGERPEPA